MKDHPIQVTCYCSEADIKPWREFLEKKGFDIITKTRREKYHHGHITKYAVYRALTEEERVGLKEGKYRMNDSGLVNMERLSTKLRENSRKKEIINA